MIQNNKKYDLEERLINFAVSIISITEKLPNTQAGKHIAGQLVRSGTSPASNYGEAQSAESQKDFIHKLKISLKELRESRIWLIILNKKNLISAKNELKSILSECEELIRIFVKCIKTAESNK